MERITFNRTLSRAVLHAWATEFNRAHREAPICASMWRLRFAALFTLGALVFLAGRALAETNADAPTGKADAVIDLAKGKGGTATRKSSKSISKRLDRTNSQPVNRPRLTISRRTPAARISTTQNGKRSIRRHSKRDAQPDGFVSTGTGSTSLYPRVYTIWSLPVQPRFSRRRSMITPKSGLMANCRARRVRVAVRE